MTKRKITSLKSYIEYVSDRRKSALEEDIVAKQWFFRGQKNEMWPLKPSVFRDDAISFERMAIDRAKRIAPSEFNTHSHFDILTKLQHYGLGTRLLDVTLNPLVALFFACESCIEYDLGKDKRYKQVVRDGVVYFNHSYWFSSSDLKIQMAARIPFIDISPDMQLDSLCERFHELQIFDEKKKNHYLNDSCKEFIDHLQGNYFVVPENTNERLLKQSGGFILPCCINIDSNEPDVKKCFIHKASSELRSEFDDTVLLIPHNEKEGILEELDFIGINESTLFPELEHQMNYLQRNTRVATGKVPAFVRYLYADNGKVATDIPDAEIERRVDERKDVCNFKKTIEFFVDPQDKNLIQAIEDEIAKASKSLDWFKKESIVSALKTRLKRIFIEQGLGADLAAKLVDEIAMQSRSD